MKIIGIEGWSDSQIAAELQRGGKFVVYKYCISIVVLTFRMSSDIYFIRAGESAFAKGIGFTLASLCLGWWGIPWGPIYTIVSLINNFGGGEDVTAGARAALDLESSARPVFAEAAPGPGVRLDRGQAVTRGGGFNPLFFAVGGCVTLVAGSAAACGLLFGLSGATLLYRGPTDNTPKMVTLSEVEAEGAEPDQWLDLTEGHLFLLEERAIGKTKVGKAGVSKPSLYYVPLVSAPVRDDWTKEIKRAENEGRYSYKNYRVFVKFEPMSFEKEFPKGMRDPGTLLERPSVPYKLTGRVVKLPAADRKLLEPELASTTEDFQIDHLIIVEPGKPISNEEQTRDRWEMTAMGLGCAFVSITIIVVVMVLLIRSMRSKPALTLNNPIP